MREKEPLYRRVNTRTRGVCHGDGGEYRWWRHAKKEDRFTRGSMHSKHRHGLDYTPLFKFLLSRVGQDWTDIYREAVARLDRPDPIFWMVARCDSEKRAIIRAGESSYYSGLYVDENNRLAPVDPDLCIENMKPRCACCTHTFNGRPYVRKYAA
jgi:hypothetical protein